MGGAVAGALAGGTLGASLMGGGVLKATGFLAADGALGSAVETGTNNALEGNKLTDGVARDAIVGAVEAPIFFGATKGIAKALPELEPVLVGDDAGSGGAAPRSPVERVKTTAARAGRATLHYLKHAPERHHSAFAVAMASQLQGWGGQLLQGIWGYLIQIPDEWFGWLDGSPAPASAPAPPASRGLTGSLGRVGAR